MIPARVLLIIVGLSGAIIGLCGLFTHSHDAVIGLGLMVLFRAGWWWCDWHTRDMETETL
jgi:hypothetical protein